MLKIGGASTATLQLEINTSGFILTGDRSFLQIIQLAANCKFS